MDDNNQKTESFHYEETPVIDAPVGDQPPIGPTQDEVPAELPRTEPVQEIPRPPELKEIPPQPPEGLSASTKQQKKQSSLVAMLGNIILFGILFAFGVGASVFIRQYLASRSEKEPTQIVPALLTPTPTAQADLLASWKSYQVINANTKQPINGISFQLPADVIAPICDGPACVSQGTYLPGGSRFTVAARGVGQVLPTTVGAIMTDAGGRSFIMKEASISGLPSQEFTGLFAGTTGGGYTFSQIRGIVIHGPVGVSLEVSHFTPTGVNANWDTDDALFDKIVETVSFGLLPTPTSVITPQASPTAILQQ